MPNIVIFATPLACALTWTVERFLSSVILIQVSQNTWTSFQTT